MSDKPIVTVGKLSDEDRRERRAAPIYVDLTRRFYTEEEVAEIEEVFSGKLAAAISSSLGVPYTEEGAAIVQRLFEESVQQVTGQPWGGTVTLMVQAADEEAKP